jgi:hypothetical protein
MPARDSLQVLRNALATLEFEPAEASRIAELKRILADRIAELESKRKTIR